jgi:hypothetical protein
MPLIAKIVIALTDLSGSYHQLAKLLRKSEGTPLAHPSRRRRPEYLRQGAVSCWGAGSPAKHRGIVITAMPFFIAQALLIARGAL